MMTPYSSAHDTMRGRECVGTPSFTAVGSCQVWVRRSMSMVRDALVTSVTCVPAEPTSLCISQLSMVPKARSFSAAAGLDGVAVVEEPAHLHPGEVGADGESADFAKRILVAAHDLLREGLAQVGGSHVQPHHRVVQRLSRALRPRHGGLALVGDAHARHVGRGRAPRHRLERARDARQGVGVDLLRIVLAPAGLGVDLLVLHLVRCQGWRTPSPTTR